MRCSWFKYLVIISLLMIFINRGVFVAMPGVEIACSTDSEINSILELVLNWAGMSNEVDEDGDCPESYSFSNSAQPLIAQNFIYTNGLERPYATACKLFYHFDESINSIDYNRTIEHPPEQLTIES